MMEIVRMRFSMKKLRKGENNFSDLPSLYQSEAEIINNAFIFLPFYDKP